MQERRINPEAQEGGEPVLSPFCAFPLPIAFPVEA